MTHQPELVKRREESMSNGLCLLYARAARWGAGWRPEIPVWLAVLE